MLRHMKRFTPLVVALLALPGCKDKPKPKPSAAASARTAASAMPPPVALPKAEPLDVAKLQKALRCTKASRAFDGPCGVLAAFKNCEALPALTQAGESRYLGEGYVVNKGAFVNQFTLLKRWRVPTNKVAAGQIPNKFAIGSIPDTRSDAIRHAKKAISKWKRGDVTKRMNAAVRYVKERNDWVESNVTQAKEGQLYVSSSAPAYLCPLKNQRVLLVQQASTTDKPGDGVYATLWPVSW